MFSRKSIVVALSLVAVLALACVMLVQAQDNRPGNTAPRGPQQNRIGANQDAPACPTRLFGPPAPAMMQRLVAELQLDEQQRTQATEMVGALARKIGEIVGERKLLEELIAEYKAEPTNPEKVKDLGAQIARQESAILQAELAMWVRFEQILTPDQRAKFWQTFPRPMNRPGAPGDGPRPPRMLGQPRVPAPPMKGDVK